MRILAVVLTLLFAAPAAAGYRRNRQAAYDPAVGELEDEQRHLDETSCRL